MKKLLVVAVAVLVSASAFAQKSLVRLDGCFDGQCDNLDLRLTGDDQDKEEKSQTIALNYAYLFTDNIGAGLTYRTHKATVDGDVTNVGDDSSTIGLSGYYNLNGGWNDTSFVALHYNMTTNGDDDTTKDSGNKETDIVLEYGHRVTVGKAFGVNFSWAPSVSYTMSKRAENDSKNDDVNSTALTLNVANVAVTF